MSDSVQDMWSHWLLQRRFGNDAPEMRRQLFEQFLYPVRDKVLQHARLEAGETLLDVGCGDGLIAFGALHQTPASQVIFSDVSQALLDEAQALAGEIGVLDRCRFMRAAAEDLSVLGDASVEVVTTRSVLIYVAAKQQAFNEFYRVLKPGGRLSIFEPINRFCWPPPHIFAGFNVTPVIDVAHLQPLVEARQGMSRGAMAYLWAVK